MMRMILPRKKSPSPQRRRHRVVPTPPPRQNLPTTIFLVITRRRDGTSRVGGLERDKKVFTGWGDSPFITNPFHKIIYFDPLCTARSSSHSHPSLPHARYILITTRGNGLGVLWAILPIFIYLRWCCTSLLQIFYCNLKLFTGKRTQTKSLKCSFSLILVGKRQNEYLIHIACKLVLLYCQSTYIILFNS